MERDQVMCVDDLHSGEPEPARQRRSFDPNELTWNIDRLDQRSVPLDGQFCPAANGKEMQAVINFCKLYSYIDPIFPCKV